MQAGDWKDEIMEIRFKKQSVMTVGFFLSLRSGWYAWNVSFDYFSSELSQLYAIMPIMAGGVGTDLIQKPIR